MNHRSYKIQHREERQERFVIRIEEDIIAGHKTDKEGCFGELKRNRAMVQMSILGLHI